MAMEASYFVLLLLLIIVGGGLACTCCLCVFALFFLRRSAHFIRVLFLGSHRRGDKFIRGGGRPGGVYYQVRGGGNGNGVNRTEETVEPAATEASLLSDAADAAMYQQAEVYVVPPLVAVRESDDSSAVVLSSPPDDIAGINSQERCGGDWGNFRDVYFAGLFIANAVAVMSIFLADASSTLGLGPQNASPGGVLPAVVVVGAAAAITGSMLLAVIIRNARHVIIYSLWSSVAINAIIGMSLVLSAVGFLPGLLFLFLALLNWWYIRSVRDRVPFAASILQIASKALRDNLSGVIACAFLFSTLQVVWLIITSVCLVNESIKDDYKRSDVLVLFLVFSMYWGNQFFIYALDVTVSGISACHYFLPNRQAIVSGSLFRALTTSAGSVAFGSMIIALLSTLHTVLRGVADRARRQRGSRSAVLVCLLTVVDHLLRLLESALNYFNRYTFAYVGCFGLGYVESSRKVTSLFRDRGWDAVINDSLISHVLSLGVLLFSIISGVTSYILGASFGQSLSAYGIDDPAFVIAALGAALAAAVGAVCARVLVAAVATLFVCFAESPEALMNNHHEEYMLMQSSWDMFNSVHRESAQKALPVASQV